MPEPRPVDAGASPEQGRLGGGAEPSRDWLGLDDRRAGHLGLLLIAILCLVQVIFEAVAAAHYVAEGRRSAGAVLGLTALFSLAFYSWIAYGVFKDDPAQIEPADAEKTP